MVEVAESETNETTGSNGTTTQAEAPTKAPAKKAAPKKVAKKAPVKKAPVKKAPVKKAAVKATGAGRAKKDGLRKAQVRILNALARNKKALSRNDIAAKAPCDLATCVEYLGSHNKEVREANDKKHFPSLITLKYVKFAAVEEGAPVAYEITATGTAALAKAST